MPGYTCTLAARARSAKRNVANGDSDSVKLLGLIPVAEDWHTKMSLLIGKHINFRKLVIFLSM